MARIRYTGSTQVYLPNYYRALRHGDEFEVPDDKADSFTRRPDFEEAPSQPEPKGSRADRSFLDKAAAAEKKAADNAADDPTGDSQ